MNVAAPSPADARAIVNLAQKNVINKLVFLH
jgi:hypothetical protein